MCTLKNNYNNNLKPIKYHIITNVNQHNRGDMAHNVRQNWRGMPTSPGTNGGLDKPN